MATSPSRVLEDTCDSCSITYTEGSNNYMIREGSSSVLRRSIYDLDADHVTDLVHWTFVFVVTPSISILGIIGNTFSLIVLAKHGFSKSSNILLFSLAISDILFMVGVNGPPKPMYEWGAGGFQYPEETAHVLYYMYHIFDSLNWGSGPTSLCIPALITVERLIAVFLPLKFPSIVTPRRTVIAVLVPNIIFYGIQVYVRTWFRFVYIYDSSRNASVGLAMRTNMYYTQTYVSRDLEIVVNSLIGLVIFVGCGCVAIGIKVKLASVKRLKMTNSTRNQQAAGTKGDTMSRTTRMLLFLCVFYTIVCSPIGLSTIMPHLMIFPVFVEYPNFRSIGVFVYHFYKFLFSVNASINFVIYIAMCRHFRATFLSLIRK